LPSLPVIVQFPTRKVAAPGLQDVAPGAIVSLKVVARVRDLKPIVNGYGEHVRLVSFSPLEVDTLHTRPEKISTAERRVEAARLRRKGMSLRAIAEALGVSVYTSHKDVSVSGLAVPERIIGRDGRSRPARVSARGPV